MPQDSILGPLLFLLYTLELFSILENKLIDYADDFTLMVVVISPGVRVAVAESLILRFGKSTHISMISNSVTHLQSYTNSAIADIAGNSTPISPVTPR